MTNINKSTIKSGSVFFVPFRVPSAEKELLIKKLDSESSKHAFKFDSSHYPDFIKYHISYANRDSASAYLKVFSIFNSKKSNSFLLQKDLSSLFFKIVDISVVVNQSSFEINENTFTGYWIISIEWGEPNTRDLLNFLSNITFFRFHYFNIDENKRSKDFINQHNNEETSIATLIENYNPALKTVLKSFDYYHKKFSVLHLINSNQPYQSEVESYEDAKKEAYMAVRVPTKKWYGQFSAGAENINFKSLSPVTRLLALDEGAIIFEPFNDNFISIRNKYAPAYLLALNQREVVHYLIFEIAKVYTDAYNEENSRLEKFNKLNKILIETKLIQIFYTVSKTTEINSFFRELQEKFMIKKGVKDVEESIEEMNALINDAYRDKQTEKLNKQRENQEEAQRKLNYLLVFIAVLSIFSAFTDAYELFDIHGKISPHFVWLGFLSLLGMGIYLFKSYSSNIHK